MKTESSLLYRTTLVLAFLVLATLVLYYGKPLLIPLTTAALFAMLLLPVVRRLERLHLGRLPAVMVALMLFLAVVVGTFSLLSAQVMLLMKDLPMFQQRFNERLEQLQRWISSMTGLSTAEQLQYLQQTADQLLRHAQDLAVSILSVTTGVLVFVGLQLVFIFLFLYYRSRLRRFLLQLLPQHHHLQANQILDQTNAVMQRYVAGVFIVILVLAVLNSALFGLAGVPHAVLFGMLAAFLNIIPYLGIWIGTAMPLIVTAVVHDSLTSLIIIVVGMWAIQQLENHILTPRITGAQVSLNMLATVLVLFIGGTLWGVAGMILFIPLLGIAKIIFDSVDELKPFGYLVGEERSGAFGFSQIRRWWRKDK
ncbi:MAG: AI-2E family transporter [Chitinophagales bacterium]|nr:AI-2E family transporter [Chitinophagales bacterium]MDW8428102.1 AI-2E family transporter [Chitinophagales bacterium]